MPYRADGSYLSVNDALAIWHPVAIDTLQQTAKKYGAFVTYKDLAEHVKATTGITYDAKYYWVGALLGTVVVRCHKEGWPALSSLVVHTDDQSVGEGYAEVLRVTGETVPEGLDRAGRLAFLDDHAAAARFECYTFFGAELPEGGGGPVLTPRITAARRFKKAAEAEPAPLCPIHRTTLPKTGICDDCD